MSLPGGLESRRCGCATAAGDVWFGHGRPRRRSATTPNHSTAAMVFTSEQVSTIEQIIDQRLSLAGLKVAPISTNKYHSTSQIRLLVRTNIDALKCAISAKVFDIVILRHELAKFTVLSDGDNELIRSGSGEFTQSRWDSQVLNAVSKPHDWEFPPLIVPAGKRRMYMFSEIGKTE